MPLNLCPRAAPYALRNHQKTNLSTEQNPWRKAEVLHSSQQPNLQISDTPDSSFLLCQPFFPVEQAESEEDGAAFPLSLFAEANENAVLQPLIQTNNGFPASYLSEVSEAVSHLFPNKFTWNLPTTIDSNLIQQNICHANFPLAEEANDISLDLSFNAIDPALQHLFNSANGVDSQALYSDLEYPSEIAFSGLPLMCGTEQLATSPAIINPSLSSSEAKESDVQPIQHQPNILPLSPAETPTQPLKQTHELTYEEAFEAFRARSFSSNAARLSPMHSDKKKIKAEDKGNSIKASRKPRENNDKRAAQNRLSQNMFREKKRKYVENLEKENAKLKETCNSLEKENIKLKDMFKKYEMR